MNVDLKYLKALVSDKANFEDEVTVKYRSEKKPDLVVDSITIRYKRKIILSVASQSIYEVYEKNQVLETLIKMLLRDLLIRGVHKQREMVKEHNQNKKDDR